MKKLLLYVLLASVGFGQTQVLQEASVAQAAAGTAGAGYYISPRRQGGGSGSPGTVTSVSITPTSTVTGTVTNASTTPAIALTAITNPSPTGSNLVAGGSVAFVSNLSLTVGAADYIIQGVSYSSPITTLTASAADPTFDRIDIVAVNSSGAAVLIEGTPAASPVAPDVDPASQLALTFYILSAGATSIPVSVTDIYHNNAEWTMSRSGTTWTLASTNNPYTGSVCIEGTAVGTGNSFTATAPGDIDLADHDSLIFYIRNKAAWPSTRQISIQWLTNGNTAKGTIVTLKNGTYGFNALTNTTAYQQISIPLSAFGANGLAVRKLRFQLAGTGTTIGAYVDDITLQGGLASVVDTTKMQWRGSYNASNLYNVNDVVISSGIQYVAIAPSVGQTPASSTTFWQPSSAAAGTGTVTAVSIASANGFTGSSTGGATPALTIIAGAITPTSVTTTGIDSATGANVTVATPITLTANAGTVDVTKNFSTASNNADTTLSFSGTPANSNQWFTYEVTNTDTSNHVWTIPSTFDVNAQALTTSFTVLAGGTETITTRWNGSRYLGYGIPSPAYSAEITVASATTTNIGVAASVNVAISGTTAITGFGTVAAGTYRQGRFTGILTFTHNASSLILPNAGSNITTAANDRFGAYSLGSGNWLVLWYQRADGTALAGSGGFSSTTTATTLQNAEQLTLSSSSTDTFVGTAGVTATSYSTGTHYTFTANTANTGAASMNINGLGAKTIVKVAGGVTTALADNDIRVGQVCDIAYDGTNFQLQSTLGNASSGGSGTVASSTTGQVAVYTAATTVTGLTGTSFDTSAGNLDLLLTLASGTVGFQAYQDATHFGQFKFTTSSGHTGVYARNGASSANGVIDLAALGGVFFQDDSTTNRGSITPLSTGLAINSVANPFNFTTSAADADIVLTSSGRSSFQAYQDSTHFGQFKFTASSGHTGIYARNGLSSANGTLDIAALGGVNFQDDTQTTRVSLVPTATGATISGALQFTDTTASTTLATGGAIFSGGVAIAKDANIGGFLSVLTAGKTLLVKSGSNAKAGTFTLTAGSATVSNTSVTANSVIVATLKTASGARTFLDIVPTAATNFVVTGAATDGGTYNYVILEVN